MLCSDKHKFVYFRIPRTANSSISKFLSMKFDCVNFDDRHSYDYKRVAGYFHFTVVRHPVERIISLWRFECRTDRGKYMSHLKNMGLIDFVKWLTRQKEYPTFMISQCEWINRIGRVNQVLRFEDLPESLTDLPFVPDDIDLSSFPRLNKSKKLDRIDPDELKKLIDLLDPFIRDDLVSFNYRYHNNYRLYPW